jgi:hypothetical protein
MQSGVSSSAIELFGSGGVLGGGADEKGFDFFPL